MARYIDAEKLIAKLHSGDNYLTILPLPIREIEEMLIDEMVGYVNEVPTADVKPIVYCKDCKFQDDIKGCIRLNVFVDKNTFYCEYAMRKEQPNE